MIVSTRKNIKASASKAILDGLANDGGLYIFDTFPCVDYKALVNLSYKDLSVHILSMLLDDYTKDEIKEVIDLAYDDKFDNANMVAFHNLENKELNNKCKILELFHGPTFAFKDMALTVLPNLLRLAKVKNGVHDDTIILTATSGDTGGATLSGFKDVKGMKVIVFYPNSKVSLLQEKQMLAYKSDNMRVIAYDGNFDDTQNFVKEMFSKYHNLSSSNSINLGRLVPQIIYYFYGYLQMVKDNDIKLGDNINVCVPCGNFGNILAGYIAKKMGLPINMFICASNKNKVLTDFFNTGVYDINRCFYKTNSPSMDILISSNLERLLYLILGSTTKLMQDLKDKGRYEIDKDEKAKLACFYANYLDEDETLDVINKVYNEEKYLLDTHSAVSYGVYLKYLKETKDNTKTLVLSTASPFKFAPSILKALGVSYNNDAIEELENYTKIKAPDAIYKYPNNEKEFWKKDDVYRNFDKLIKELGYHE